MTARDRRAVTWGGGVVVAALVLRVLPWSLRAVSAAREDLRQRATLLARARAELARAPLLRDSATVLAHALVGLGPRLLSGDTPAEAMADLSGRLNLAASRNQARLERVDQLPDSGVAGRLHRVRVRAALECDVRGATGVLRAIAHGDAVLPVESVRIVAPDPGSSERTAEVLRVEITVAGWFLVNAGTGKRET